MVAYGSYIIIEFLRVVFVFQLAVFVDIDVIDYNLRNIVGIVEEGVEIASSSLESAVYTVYKLPFTYRSNSANINTTYRIMTYFALFIFVGFSTPNFNINSSTTTNTRYTVFLASLLENLVGAFLSVEKTLC